MSRPYFAYGSNIDRAQMRARCPGALFAGVARLPGHRFTVNRHGYATVVPDAASEVYGVLWRINEAGERALDRYEGVAEGLYRKTAADVELLGRAPARVDGALIYVAVDARPGRPRASYLELILAAARQHGFPRDYVRRLERWAARGRPA